jgi:hypothetical protein
MLVCVQVYVCVHVNKDFQAGGMAEVEECLPTTHKVLSSNHPKKKKTVSGERNPNPLHPNVEINLVVAHSGKDKTITVFNLV